ncbi:DUF732 domain-containing protein [Rhodococcus sp. Q]|uniref:DUF732 domain-containing protein n=1 Tax=Rhodococcus sp. Q TaxID=2502252 RepID=UPI001485219D|nr:DUF732 domain-containing protein [Rhodococcus sp. Q]
MSEDDSGDRGFRFKSTAERLVPLRRDECRNCTRPAVPGGRLCKECLIAYRSDRSVGQYPMAAAAWILVAGLSVVVAAVVLVPELTGDDAPAQADATSTYTPEPVYSEPEPDSASEPVFTVPEPTARSNSQSSSGTSQAAFIATLNANDVEYSTKSNAVALGESICKVVRNAVDAGFTMTDGMDYAESTLVERGFAANDAAAYVGAAVGALC